MAKNKKVFKSLAVAALATSAIVPVASANTTTTYSDIVTSVNGQLTSITQEQYNLAVALGKNPTVEYVKVDNKFYSIAEYNLKVAIVGAAKAFEELAKTGTVATITPSVGAVDGSGNITNNAPVTGELKVESVSAITSTYVEVTFEALADKVEGATVEVKDNKGNVVEVVAQDLAKGAKSAQFDFKAEYKADQEGVWTVNGEKFSFDIKAQLEAIAKAASEGNEVKLLAALEEAGLENVNEELISDYLEAIAGEELTSLEDVQAILNEVNEDALTADDKEVAVNAVVAATTQPQLLKALKDNFELVNADWIKEYADAEVIAAVVSPASPAVSLLDVTAKNAPDTLTFEKIQDIIETENKDAIDTEDGNADTSAKQAAVTALIQKWVKADEGTATDKADQVALSQLHTAAFKVAEATTNSAVINTLTAYANISTTTLKATDVLDVNKAAYLAEIKGTGAVTGFTAANIKTAISTNKGAKLDDISLFATKVAAVNTAEEGTSRTALVAAAEAYVDGPTATTKEAFDKALKDLAAKTANKAAADKINLNVVDSEKLLEYATAIDTAAGTPTNVNATGKIATIISNTNSGETVSAAVETVNKATSTATQVRDALTELVISVDPSNADDYLSLSNAAKLEVAELVIAARPDGGFVESTSGAADVDEVIAAEAVTQAQTLVGFLTAFNTIKVTAVGAEVTYSYSTVSDVLDTIEGTDYAVLSGSAKVAATEKFFASITVTSKELADGSVLYTQQKFTSLAEIKAAIDAASK